MKKINEQKAYSPEPDKEYFDSEKDRIKFLWWYAEKDPDIKKLMKSIFGRNKYTPKKTYSWKNTYLKGRSLLVHRISEEKIDEFKNNGKKVNKKKTKKASKKKGLSDFLKGGKNESR